MVESLSTPQAYKTFASSLLELPPTKQTEALRWLCRNDLYFLLRFVLRRKDLVEGRTSRAAQWILNRCLEVESAPNGHLDLWAREHFKTTLHAGLLIQDILKTHGEGATGREVTIGLFGQSRPISKRLLRMMKREFEENVQLLTVFPDVLYKNPRMESPKWSEDDGLVVRRDGNPKEATVEAWGLVDAMPVGSHYGIRFYDDMVTQESVTEGMLPKTTEAWELSTSLGSEGGVERYAGTRYHDQDTYGTILERRAAIPRIYPATDDGTATGRPVLFSDEYWEKKKRENSPATINTQYLLDPTPGEDSFFTESMFRRYDYHHPPPGVRYVRKYAASDLALSEGRGDWTVHGIGGVDPAGDLYLLDWWRQRVLPDKWVKAWIDLIVTHRPLAWGVEKGHIDKMAGPLLRTMMQERNAWCHFEPFVSATDKEERCLSIRGRTSAGKVWLPKNAPWTPDLLPALVRVPPRRPPDQY